FGLLLGLRTEYIHDFWRLQILVNGGFGAVQNQKIIQGSSQTESGNLFFLTANTGSELLHGGIFTQPSNIGCFSCHAASGMFETTVRFGYSVRENIEINAGYNGIVLARIARAASIIDRQINSTRTSLADASRATVGIGPGPIPFGTTQAAPIAQGANSPIALNHTRHFWAQGLSIGLMINF
ncbi:MAG TPA: BBP7 family outer membrane beta-barrel protein, partial [Candidatus Babeliales bacterium]|nr:BBP7 family outer membrane beta-barrel protein [Candidatus Babeliales bacterium]